MDPVFGGPKIKYANSEYRPERRDNSDADSGEDGYPVGVAVTSVPTASEESKSNRRPPPGYDPQAEMFNYFGIQWKQPDPQTFLKMREAHRAINIKLSLLKS